VNSQIWIANKQIKIAEEELKAVKADFALAQRQFNELTRRPQITVGLRLTRPQHPWILATFTIENNGDKLSRELRLEIAIADVYFNEVARAQKTSDFEMGTKEEKDGSYAVMSRAFGRPLYPNGLTRDFQFPWLSMKDGATEFTVRFRAYDENFAYPATGYGDVTMGVSEEHAEATYEPIPVKSAESPDGLTGETEGYLVTRK